jgi:hypothetical protein
MRLLRAPRRQPGDGAGDRAAEPGHGLRPRPAQHRRLHLGRRRIVEPGGRLGQDPRVQLGDLPLTERLQRGREPVPQLARGVQPLRRHRTRDAQRTRDLLTGEVLRQPLRRVTRISGNLGQHQLLLEIQPAPQPPQPLQRLEALGPRLTQTHRRIEHNHRLEPMPPAVEHDPILPTGYDKNRPKNRSSKRNLKIFSVPPPERTAARGRKPT